MSDFKAKMHENRFRLALRPRPHWGSLHAALPRSLAGFNGPTSKGRDGEGGRKMGRQMKGRGGKKEEGRGRETPPGLGM